eukprot:TRINITY_DN16381_c0_g2_i2.p1 TRINITY_DN16381_c0_g2~~TRINITY_DN16381_c0_g2_i2.p1  ORF type:complete len:490 (+),score=117.47 TRINITY_DN16381_c0_g2_i2:181-1650(+)
MAVTRDKAEAALLADISMLGGMLDAASADSDVQDILFPEDVISNPSFSFRLCKRALFFDLPTKAIITVEAPLRYPFTPILVRLEPRFQGDAIVRSSSVLDLIERVNMASVGRLLSHRPCTLVDAATALYQLTKTGGRGLIGSNAVLGREISASGYALGRPPPIEDSASLLMLTPEQTLAMCHVRANAKQLYGEAFVQLLPRCERLGYTPAQLQRCMDYVREEAPIIIHFHVDRCLDFLMKDTHYRNQFETGTSSGSLSRDSRTAWENSLFSNAYQGVKDFDRVKYGVMNVVNDPNGITAAYSYGNSYMVLKHARLRCSFANQDTGGGSIAMLASCDYYAHVLQAFSDPELEACMSVACGVQSYVASSVIASYKECQIHGEVCLSHDVAAFVINQQYKNSSYFNKLEALSKKHGGVPVLWMDEVEPAHLTQVAQSFSMQAMSTATAAAAEEGSKLVDPEQIAKVMAEERKASMKEAAAGGEPKCNRCALM